MKVAVVLLAIFAAGAAIAEAPEASMRPTARALPADPLAGFRPVARAVVATPVMDQEAAYLMAAGQPVLKATISSSSFSEDLVTSRASDALTGPMALSGGDARPQLRPEATPVAVVIIRPVVRPYERLDLAISSAARGIELAETQISTLSSSAVWQSLRPEVRPAAFVREAEERQVARVRGQVCGDPAIQGEAIGRVEGPGACGVEGAVRVRSIAGVALSSRAVMDCRTAQALKRWVENGAVPAVGNQGGGIEAIRVIGTYSCRNRNGASTGKLSEHAHGRAIDIAGIRLQNGSEISVLNHWNSSRYGDTLRKMWRAACGPFGTVLGPNANRAHRDHFHFDTARYRSGSYCR